jgi:hypothetical protein
MANRYLKATGDYSNDNTWSATDGGAAGASAPISTDDVFLTANGNGLTLTLDGASAAKTFVASGGCTATLAGTQTLTVEGNVTLLATMTVPNTITFTVNGTGNFAASTLATLGSINLNGTAHTLSGATPTCVNLTRNGTALKTDTLTITAGTTWTVTGTCALIGNSAVNRLLVQSSTLGTAATINAAATTGTNAVDFMDITGAGAATWDLSAAAAYSGDCGGNTMKALGAAAFTTSAAQTSASTDTWSTAAKWTSRVPLPQDDVTCSHNSTVDMPRIGRSITFTGTPTISLSNDISTYGSWTMVSGMTYTPGTGSNIFRGRDVGMPVGGWLLNTATKSLYVWNLYAPNGTLKLASNLTWNTTLSPAITNGTFNADTYNMAGGGFYFTGSLTRGVLLGTGTHTFSRTDATTKWNAGTTTLLTFDAGTSTIILSSSLTNAQTFAGGTLTYNNVTVQGAGAYALTVSGDNTFNTFTVDRSVAAKTITGTAGSVQQVNTFVSPTSSNMLTLNSTGAAWTLTKVTSGFTVLDYITIPNNSVLVTPNTRTWYYGRNSSMGTGNTGWNYGTPGSRITKLLVGGL